MSNLYNFFYFLKKIKIKQRVNKGMPHQNKMSQTVV